MPLARMHVGALVVLSLLTLTTSLLVAGLPRTMQGAFDLALEKELAAAAGQQADLAVRYEPSSDPASRLTDPAAFATVDATLRGRLPDLLKRVLAPPGRGGAHMSAKTWDTPVAGTGGTRYVNLAWMSDSGQHVEWVAGRAPDALLTSEHEGRRIPLFEIGVVEDAVAKLGLEIGTTKVIGESDYNAVRVVGVFRPKNPGSPWWTHHPEVRDVDVVQPPGGGGQQFYTTALLPDAGLRALGPGRKLAYSWILPADPPVAAEHDPLRLRESVAEFGRAVSLVSDHARVFRTDSALSGLLTAFTGKIATARTVIYLVLGGLMVVALGVIALAAQLAIGRMDRALSLMRARGASLGRVTLTGTFVIGLAAVPATLAGYALAYLVPGPLTTAVHLGPVLLAVVTLAFTALRVAAAHRTPLSERRDDVVASRPSPKRVTLEVLVVVLALVGAYLMRTRGLTTAVEEQGEDPFLLLVPVALTVAAALVTLRVYPYPLRLLVRVAARTRPAVPFLGLTRAARAGSFTVLAILVLLPALAVAVFSSVVSGGLSATQDLASWQRAGAPARLQVTTEFPAEAVERVRRVPGVTDVVPVQTGRVQIGHTSERAEIVAVDLARWQNLLAGTPITLPAPPAGAGVPALYSPALKGRGTLEIGWNVRMTLTESGGVGALPGLFTGQKFIVVPLDANRRVAPNVLLLGGDIDLGAVTAAIGTADVFAVGQAEELSRIADDPLAAAITRVLGVSTVALGAYALVSVVISLVVGAADRARAVSFLRTLGLSGRQAQALTLLEISPMIVMTALVGLALGLGLPSALGPGVNLSRYAGNITISDYELHLLPAVLLAAGLAAVTLLGAYAHTALSRRRSLGSVLRVSD
ncbi:FtsX-like permease family protein [Nonomuraea longicatena]|uniref:FtsX-like permease family protein n=2 Tax=Nonomuraea longicatena TaxID=83682 RepID=A0ABN1PKQ7_9ACTN